LLLQREAHILASTENKNLLVPNSGFVMAVPFIATRSNCNGGGNSALEEGMF
jgi:hypothetical protein